MRDVASVCIPNSFLCSSSAVRRAWTGSLNNASSYSRAALLLSRHTCCCRPHVRGVHTARERFSPLRFTETGTFEEDYFGPVWHVQNSVRWRTRTP
jgi:hypothetical protein